MKSTGLVLFAAICVGAAGADGKSPDKSLDESVQKDRQRIRKSLQEGMEKTPRDKVQARLGLVREIGISGLDKTAKPPEVGQPAPDFELMPIKMYRWHGDSEAGGKNTVQQYQPVRLSGFRGKKPVLLIFGSYT